MSRDKTSVGRLVANWSHVIPELTPLHHAAVPSGNYNFRRPWSAAHDRKSAAERRRDALLAQYGPKRLSTLVQHYGSLWRVPFGTATR